MQQQINPLNVMQARNGMNVNDMDFFEDMDQTDIVGVIKIKDGLFICDELGAQVSHFVLSHSENRPA